MFKLVQADYFYFWPVKISVPVDGGKHEEKTIDLKFKRLPQSEYDKALDEIAKGNIKSIEFAKSLIVGWKNVVDEENAEVPFSDESLNLFLEIPNAAIMVFKEYNRSINEIKIKN